jgi:hypothetical protein
MKNTKSPTFNPNFSSTALTTPPGTGIATTSDDTAITPSAVTETASTPIETEVTAIESQTVPIVSDRKAALMAEIKAEQELAELDDLEQELELMRAKRSASKLATQNAREAAKQAEATLSLEVEQSTQRIAQLEFVPGEAKLTEVDLAEIKHERVALAVRRKDEFLQALKASNDVEYQAIDLSAKKFQAEADNRLLKLEQAIPQTLRLAPALPTETVTIETHGVTIEATVL